MCRSFLLFFWLYRGSLRSGCLGGINKIWRKRKCEGRGGGEKRRKQPARKLGSLPPPPISHLTTVMSPKRENVKHIKLELTKINPHGTKMYLTCAVKGEEEKQKKKAWMITADYKLKCTLKRKFGDFEKIECIGEGIVVLGCSPSCLKICMGRRWRNRTNLPRGFERLVALNKKCTGSAKASVGNQSSNFEC